MDSKSGLSLEGLLISGTHSSVGKSSIASGLMRLLKRRGFTVKPFKVGPDYIDPGHHQRACGLPSYNLDTFMSTQNYVRNVFADRMRGGGIAVVEGVMGLYDGAYPTKPLGSTAEIAKLLNLPVLFVIEPTAMARSAAALVNGFLNFDTDIRFAGVIANRINSEGHAQILKKAIQHHTSARFLGYLPSDEKLRIPSRHLGLFMGNEQKDLLYDLWADHLERHIDISALSELFKHKNRNGTKDKKSQPVRWRPKPAQGKFTVAVARDQAFQFIYPDTIDMFQHFGGTVKYFSPLSDKSLPKDIDWVYLPGGYPENHAKKLSANKVLVKELRAFGNSGKTIVGECGGMMYLGKKITDESGKNYPMIGLFDFATTLKKKKMTLGYRQLTYPTQAKLGKKINLRGHEFHYSTFTHNREQPRMVQSKNGKDFGVRDGYRCKNCFALYSHIYWGSSPDWLKYILKVTK